MHLIDLILQDNSITLTQGSDQTVISSVRCDSRTVDAGTLFVCISGEASKRPKKLYYKLCMFDTFDVEYIFHQHDK